MNIIHLYLDENNLTPDNREEIKDFRAQLRGFIDKKFFIFRLVKIFG